MPEPSLSATQSRLTALASDSSGADLPPLSTVALEVGRLSAAHNGEGDSAAALSNLIRRDVALASQVIRVANSALHAPRTPIVSLTQAITRLGMNEIRNIAYSSALRANLFSSSAISAVWCESLATACFAQEIARLKRRDVESAYLGGLMHRVGLAVMLWRLLRSANNTDIITPAVEEFAAEGHEAFVGALLAQTWKLPAPIAASIMHWRDPRAAEPTHQLLLIQIAAARALAAQLSAPDDLPVELSGIAPEWLDALNLYPDDVARLLALRAGVRSAVQCYA